MHLYILREANSDMYMSICLMLHIVFVPKTKKSGCCYELVSHIKDNIQVWLASLFSLNMSECMTTAYGTSRRSV